MSPTTSGAISTTVSSPLDFPKEGVKLSWVIDVFIPTCGIENLQGLTTLQVCKDFVMRQTGDDPKSSYCQKLKAVVGDDSEVVGKPTVFTCL